MFNTDERVFMTNEGDEDKNGTCVLVLYLLSKCEVVMHAWVGACVVQIEVDEEFVCHLYVRCPCKNIM